MLGTSCSLWRHDLAKYICGMPIHEPSTSAADKQKWMADRLTLDSYLQASVADHLQKNCLRFMRCERAS